MSNRPMDSSAAQSSLDGIAIIGMAGRFPGANNIDEFWQNLCAGVESITRFSDDDLRATGVEPALLQHSDYVKAGGILEGIEEFDAAFFGFSPREAEMMDPQHRLFLESAWAALEQAGYNPDTYPGRIGAFAGNGWSSYLFNNLRAHPDRIAAIGGYQTLIGNDKDFLTTRLAYKFNLRGPSYTVQTACSTSLVAVTLACHSLFTHQCDMALAGGATVFVPHQVGYLYQEGGILSPDGHCRVFDAKAQGTVVGNGVGVVVLKRLEDAIANGDAIHAVIKGAAINNDGAAKVGYTAPSIAGQAEVIAEALAFAEIDPETITYIEAHGTGTALGDPIEIAALTQAFRTQTQNRGFCAIGSVKSNIGHLDAAAGIAGLIKTVLALQHRQIPPSLHFEQPNPQIDFVNSPFYVNTTLRDWTTNGTPRRAGVSSFGIGGTNAHVIVEEAPVRGERGKWGDGEMGHEVIVLSAKTPTALDAATQQLAKYLQQRPELELADVAYTLQVGRKAFNYRRMLVCRDKEEAIAGLSNPPQPCLSGERAAIEPPVVFLFPGQGAQYPHMGRELYQHHPCFRQWVDRACALLEPELGLDLRQVLYGDAQANAALLNQTAYAQPALFVVEYALAQVWISWGVQPQAFIGHSIGEYVAACLAGVFSLEEALKLVAVRGRLMQSLPSGAMLSVALSEAEVRSWLQSDLYADLALAASNAPKLCVVSGREGAIAQLETHLNEQGIACRRLHTSHAFHSPMMEPILAEFEQQVSQVSRRAPKIPILSNLTGTWMSAAEAIDPVYWVKHLRQTVRFSDGIAELLKQPQQVLLEVGPGRTLRTFAQPHLGEETIVLSSLPHPRDDQSEQALIWQTIGQLWLAGVSVDWSALHTHQQRYRVPLPTYPFERQRYWIEPPLKQAEDDRFTNSLMKQSNPADWFYLPSWKRSSLTPDDIASLRFPCLMFVDDQGIGLACAQQLAEQKQDIIIVRRGGKFAQLDTNEYTIAPHQPDNYHQLIENLKTNGKIPRSIVHLWSLDQSSIEINSIHDNNLSTCDRFEQIQYLGYYSLLFLTQALGNQSLTEPLSLTVVTQNLYDVTGNELLCPEQAPIVGLLRVIPQEYASITCRHIDLGETSPVGINPAPSNPAPSADASAQNAQLVHQLVAELLATPSFQVTAYRNQHRWVQTFDRLPLNKALNETPNTTSNKILNKTIESRVRLRDGGVYLITGAWGDVSLVLAEYLAQTVRAKLILLEHPDCPERDAWGQQKLQHIQALSSEVVFIQADVANLEQMQAAIAQIDQQFGALHGVIHAAETNQEASFRPIQQTRVQDCQWHFQPKVYGLYVLATVLQGRSLDFCLLQSSLSPLVGGFAAHAAANGFMDAFAHQQNRTRSFPWISINWEGWQFWEERQMGVGSQKTADWALLPNEGITAFQRLLHAFDYSPIHSPQIIVSTVDLSARMTRQTHAAVAGRASTSESTAVLPAQPPQEKDAPRNAIEQAIATIWQDLLGVESIGIHDNFFDLGGHSLLAVQTISRLREIFQVEIPLRSLLLETPTISGLADVIAAHQPPSSDLDEMAQMLAEIEQLSSAEIQAKLAQESQASL